MRFPPTKRLTGAARRIVDTALRGAQFDLRPGGGAGGHLPLRLDRGGPEAGRGVPAE
ncbi:MAG: hypothetical protein VCF08_17910 [Alphaproteobacteria bacterium]